VFVSNNVKILVSQKVYSRQCLKRPLCGFPKIQQIVFFQDYFQTNFIDDLAYEIDFH